VPGAVQAQFDRTLKILKADESSAILCALGEVFIELIHPVRISWDLVDSYLGMTWYKTEGWKSSTRSSLKIFTPALQLNEDTAIIPLLDGDKKTLGEFTIHLIKNSAKIDKQQQEALLGYASICVAAFIKAKAKSKTDEERSANDETLSLALMASSMGTWEWNPATDHLIMSEQTQMIMGFKPGTFNGGFYSQFVALVHPDDQELIKRTVERAVQQKKDYKLEYRLIWEDGSVHWVHARGRAIYDAETQTPIRMLGTLVQIDHRKKAETELLAAVTARDEFLSIASHELKTPLATLHLQAQLRTKNLAKENMAAFTPEKLQKMNEMDTRQIKLLICLVDDMLDISRLRSGKLTIKSESCDLSQLAREVTDGINLSIKDSTSTISIHAPLGIIGNWDRYRIEQILNNLLTNAIRYGNKKPIEVKVTTQNGRARLTVRDSGIGIEVKDQKRIFQRFERAGPSSEASGLGLGLYITQQIVIAHGGSVSVESQLGKGSCFTVDLPLHNEKGEDDGQ